jgi:hypothetical protein
MRIVCAASISQEAAWVAVEPRFGDLRFHHPRVEKKQPTTADRFGRISKTERLKECAGD